MAAQRTSPSSRPSTKSPPNSPARKLKRPRTKHACDECRRSQKKCDGERPVCHRCSLNGTKCTYTPHKSRGQCECAGHKGAEGPQHDGPVADVYIFPSSAYAQNLHHRMLAAHANILYQDTPEASTHEWNANMSASATSPLPLDSSTSPSTYTHFKTESPPEGSTLNALYGSTVGMSGSGSGASPLVHDMASPAYTNLTDSPPEAASFYTALPPVPSRNSNSPSYMSEQQGGSDYDSPASIPNSFSYENLIAHPHNTHQSQGPMAHSYADHASAAVAAGGGVLPHPVYYTSPYSYTHGHNNANRSSSSLYDESYSAPTYPERPRQAPTLYHASGVPALTTTTTSNSSPSSTTNLFMHTPQQHYSVVGEQTYSPSGFLQHSTTNPYLNPGYGSQPSLVYPTTPQRQSAWHTAAAASHEPSSPIDRGTTTTTSTPSPSSAQNFSDASYYQRAPGYNWHQ
ncbi:hypothetical protein BD410DRAFT_844027 [Rickenella mellea]|uniref:Zn(2)-C6 fungal-type domain-containing protein n=1 Tax=Rickenella mellea TaxID=50990 RepID=A0A4Y7PQZ6_9AGAM|nr:hypothetical protein BD410DRAFT_844027 [Rickenella mellea]